MKDLIELIKIVNGLSADRTLFYGVVFLLALLIAGMTLDSILTNIATIIAKAFKK